MLGVNTSALRYYEERGLVTPITRRGGRRMYGREQLRRLAFVQLLQRLGISLDAAYAVLEEPRGRWRAVVREQIVALEDLIARAEGGRDFLAHALGCPTEHPVRECPHMIAVLDRGLSGTTIEQLAAEQGRPLPIPLAASRRKSRPA